MIYVLLISSAALVAAFTVSLLIMDRRDARAAAERAADRVERQILLQRIQAPQEAVYEHATRTPLPPPQDVGLDDDEAFWAASNPVLTRERLAEQLERHELGEE